MNTYLIDDDNFKNTTTYKDYLKNNPAIGYLKIRAYTANEAIPIQGIEITITKTLGNSNIVFFKGITDESGIIEKISLPAPKSSNNLEPPSSTKYVINAAYGGNNQTYTIAIYENVHVVQTINVVPKMNMGGF